MTEDEIREQTIKEVEKKDQEFDKERQRADQAEANFKKAQAEAKQKAEQLAQLQAKIEQQQQQLAELQAKNNATQEIDQLIPEINPDEASFEDLTRAVLAAKKVISEQAKKLASLETVASQYQQETAKERQEREAQARRNAILEEVCNDLEREFGAGLRNDAIKLMEQINAKKGIPSNPAKAVLRLRDCFKRAKAARDRSPQDMHAHVATDVGGGGGRPSLGGAKIQKGSLDEVYQQYARASGG